MSFAEHFVFCAFSRLIALRAASRSPSPSVFTPSAAMSLADLVTVINDLSAASQFNQLLTHLQSQEEMMIQQLPQLDEALASQRHVVAAAAAAKNRAASRLATLSRTPFRRRFSPRCARWSTRSAWSSSSRPRRLPCPSPTCRRCTPSCSSAAACCSRATLCRPATRRQPGGVSRVSPLSDSAPSPPQVQMVPSHFATVCAKFANAAVAIAAPAAALRPLQHAAQVLHRPHRACPAPWRSRGCCPWEGGRWREREPGTSVEKRPASPRLPSPSAGPPALAGALHARAHRVAAGCAAP